MEVANHFNSEHNLLGVHSPTFMCYRSCVFFLLLHYHYLVLPYYILCPSISLRSTVWFWDHLMPKILTMPSWQSIFILVDGIFEDGLYPGPVCFTFARCVIILSKILKMQAIRSLNITRRAICKYVYDERQISKWNDE